MDVFDALRVMLLRRGIVKCLTRPSDFELRYQVEVGRGALFARNVVVPSARWFEWMDVDTFLHLQRWGREAHRFAWVRPNKAQPVKVSTLPVLPWLQAAGRFHGRQLDIFDAVRLALKRGGTIETSDCGSWQCNRETGDVRQTRRPMFLSSRNAVALEHCITIYDLLSWFRSDTVTWTEGIDGRL